MTLSFAQLDIFLSIFQAIGDQNNIAFLPNAQIQASLFSAIFGIASQQFSGFSNEQWSKYFHYKFNLFLSSITESQVQQIPLGISCAAFKSVISGLSSHYNALNESAQTACFQYAKTYLNVNKPPSGPACPASSGGSGEWLQMNFALFSEIGTIEDIKDVYPGFIFTDAIAELTAEQLGYYVANGQVLSEKAQVSKVMGGITSATIEEFVDAFNKGMIMSGITQITNIQVKKFLLGEIFCKLG
ncbi:uncharacterized protein LOC121008720 [Bufo bufo]|uniref:uncharacterized protein LOC121008720 n=1 Tax=Bufo bufo TaxID=8384 RepID=UPI001ABDFFFB|nr:uncharacterized protein LOC121008720 [Bufo bufo]